MNSKHFTLLLIVFLAGGWFFLKPKENQNTNTPPTPTNQQQEVVNNNNVDKEEDSVDTKYKSFSKEDFDKNQDKRRILFFHASWCPTCKVADKDITSNLNKIPEDVVVFKTNYDTEKDLKQKHDITYQHTFVQVDEDGNQITKWTGGNTKEILENLI
ncbi:thioredoxin family protein [Patescibacteria group bacterium]